MNKTRLIIADGTRVIDSIWGKIEEIAIPNDVEIIGDCAFYNCSSLTEINIPDSVTSIGNCAFLGCSSLTEITIGNSVTSIGDYAFHVCNSLESIYINKEKGSIDIGVHSIPEHTKVYWKGEF